MQYVVIIGACACGPYDSREDAEQAVQAAGVPAVRIVPILASVEQAVSAVEPQQYRES